MRNKLSSALSPTSVAHVCTRVCVCVCVWGKVSYYFDTLILRDIAQGSDPVKKTGNSFNQHGPEAQDEVWAGRGLGVSIQDPHCHM